MLDSALSLTLQGKVVGVFQKDETEFTGDFVEGWRSAMENTKLKQVSTCIITSPVITSPVIVVIGCENSVAIVTPTP